MELETVIKKRKSIRAFTDKKVSWKAALNAIESANQCPFAGNHNNLKFLIIENKEIIKKIAGLADQQWISQSSLLILVCSDDTNLENLYGERGRVYSRQQAGSVIQTILLKLVDLGLAACWVGAYSDEILKEILDIPQHIQIEAIIPIGYEDKTPFIKKPKKKELENVLYWEKWRENKRSPLFKEPEQQLAIKEKDDKAFILKS